jgi:hypothetical protein
MKRTISRAARTAFAALVAAGLTFGAGAALAAPDPRPACTYDPETGRIGVSCSVHSNCLGPCSDWWGDYNPGRCMNGCCVCHI